MGSIYFLQDPNSKAPFYVGATTMDPVQRLYSHYRHLGECEAGLRNWNPRFEYLRDLLPDKALMHIIETGIEGSAQLDLAERTYIMLFKGWGFRLMNQTQGGKGGDTLSSLTEAQKALFRERMRSKLSGVAKPKGFSENLSKARMGSSNTMAGTGKYPPIVCFRAGVLVRMFEHGYQVKAWSGSKDLHANVIKSLTGKLQRYRPFGHEWKFLNDCDQQIQDIVQSHYESMSQEERDGTLYVNS